MNGAQFDVEIEAAARRLLEAGECRQAAKEIFDRCMRDGRPRTVRFIEILIREKAEELAH